MQLNTLTEVGLESILLSIYWIAFFSLFNEHVLEALNKTLLSTYSVAADPHVVQTGSVMHKWQLPPQGLSCTNTTYFNLIMRVYIQ